MKEARKKTVSGTSFLVFLLTTVIHLSSNAINCKFNESDWHKYGLWLLAQPIQVLWYLCMTERVPFLQFRVFWHLRLSWTCLSQLKSNWYGVLLSFLCECVVFELGCFYFCLFRSLQSRNLSQLGFHKTPLPFEHVKKTRLFFLRYRDQ